MQTVNKIVGNRFEDDMAEILAEHGFWAHVAQQKKSGQPADIIAVKGRFHTLIDAKVISNDKGFPFSNIEENQRLAMKTFKKRCNELCYFAIRFPNEGIRLISLTRIEKLEYQGHKRITPRMIESETMSLEAWLEASDSWAED